MNQIDSKTSQRNQRFPVAPSSSRFLRELSLLAEGLFYVLPSLLILTLFLFWPMFKTIYFSLFLTDAAGVPVEFIGLQHYVRLLKSGAFLNSVRATFLFVLFTVPTGILLSLFLAVLGNRKMRGITLFRAVCSSSLGVSVASAATLWLFLFHPSIGLLNRVLFMFGHPGIPWLTSPDWAMISVSAATVWMSTGFMFIVFLGGMQSIPAEMYESACIDGAGSWSQFRHITLPLLSPTIFFVAVVGLIQSFQTFGQIDLLTQGGPAQSTNVIVYSIYKDAFAYTRYGRACAEAVLLFLLVFTLTLVQFKVGEKKVHYQ